VLFGKSAKDRLIEHLEAELRAARHENSQLRDENSQLRDGTAPRRDALGKAGDAETKKPASRFMGDRVRRLSERSFYHALLRDPQRKLVAEMPPPGAHMPASAFEGTRGE